MLIETSQQLYNTIQYNTIQYNTIRLCSVEMHLISTEVPKLAYEKPEAILYMS